MKKGEKPKLSLIILGAFVLLLLGVGIYLWQNYSYLIKTPPHLTTETPVEPEILIGGETYKNEEYGFEMSYPKDWGSSVNKEKIGLNLLSISLEKKDPTQEKVLLGPEGEEASYWINFNVEDNPKNLSPREKYLSYFSTESRTEAEEKIEEITVGGVEGIKYPEPAAPASGPSTMVLLSHNGKFYQFTYSAMAHAETHEKFLPVFNQILENFKFVE